MNFKPKTKTILFVMPRLPFPATNGRKKSLYHYCRIISANLGYRLVVAAFLENGDKSVGKPGFIDRLVILENASTKVKIMQLLFQSIISKKLPMQVSLYWSNAAKKQVDDLIKEEKPDVVIADMIRCTEYIKDSPCFKISDLDDRISLRYKRQLISDVSSINPYGTYITSFPKVIQNVLLWNPVKLFVMKNEVALLERYETEIGKRFNTTIFVAQSECDSFNEEIGEKKAFAVPIGVDAEFFTRSKPLPDNHIIGFLGALNAAHNEQAVLRFVNDILPLVRKSVPDVTFLVIGGGARENLLALESDSVHFTGRVPDVRESLEECNVFVCPMTFGSGIKTKLLEGMSMEIPVVTTSIGAENIDAEDQFDWFIENDNIAFAERITYLFRNYDAAKNIGISGRKFVQDKFSWETAERCFKEILIREK